MPQTLISDRGTVWNSKFSRAVFNNYGVELNLNSPYHPETDGQTERMNRLLEDMLRHYISPTQNDWNEWLPLLQFATNNSWQESIQSTPFFLNTGAHPVNPSTAPLHPDWSAPGATNLAKQIHIALRNSRVCMRSAQQRQKIYADQRRRHATSHPGELVLLQAKNFRFTAPGKKKLFPKFIGPFTVIRMIGKAAVELQFPTDGNWNRLHTVYHISLLRKYIACPGDTVRPPPLKFEDNTPVFEVDHIVDHRSKTVKHKDGSIKTIGSHYLVRWKGWTPEYDTWEPVANLAGAPTAIRQYLNEHRTELDG
jgi:hypothetical protein